MVLNNTINQQQLLRWPRRLPAPVELGRIELFDLPTIDGLILTGYRFSCLYGLS